MPIIRAASPPRLSGRLVHRKQRVDAPGLSSRNVLLAVAVPLAPLAPAPADVNLKEMAVSMGLAGSGNGTDESTFVTAGGRSRRVRVRRTGKRAKVGDSDAENVMATITATAGKRSAREAPEQPVQRQQQGAAASEGRAKE